MTNNDLENPKNSLELFGLDSYFENLVSLHINNKLPRIMLISGNKGEGKFTLINHLLTYIFDKDNYNIKNKTINNSSFFYKQYLNNVFTNIVYLSGEDFKNANIENIRALKENLLKTTISSSKRYIVLDDVELFNISCLNALLKIIEEPSSNNNFILIYNKNKSLIETVRSRCLEIKFFLKENTRKKIISSLVKKYELNTCVDYNNLYISPGIFLSVNKLFEENKIDINGDYLKNLNTLLGVYKKSKIRYYLNVISFLTDYYFDNKKKNNSSSFNKIVDDRNFVTKNISNFITYNLNQTSIIHEIRNRLNNG